MIYHDIYDSWSWTGGHADGEEDMLRTALKEAEEETGLKGIAPLSENIFSIEIVTVDGHYKRGVYVSSHLHLNVTYLLSGDNTAPIKHKEGENSGVKWFSLDEAVMVSTEPWLRENIYSKLNKKLKIIQKYNNN